jgi:hypothetical protein
VLERVEHLPAQVRAGDRGGPRAAVGPTRSAAAAAADEPRRKGAGEQSGEEPATDPHRDRNTARTRKSHRGASSVDRRRRCFPGARRRRAAAAEETTRPQPATALAIPMATPTSHLDGHANRRAPPVSGSRSTCEPGPRADLSPSNDAIHDVANARVSLGQW